MFNPRKEHSKCCGQLVDGVKFIQEGRAYGTSGKFLGKFADGKLVKQVKADPIVGELDKMDRPALLEFAMKEHGLKLKGNASAETLRQQIREHDVS